MFLPSAAGCFAGSLFAQYDPKALEILDNVSDKYEKLNGFQADFVYTLNNDASRYQCRNQRTN